MAHSTFLTDKDDVYEPAEDTYLLLRAAMIESKSSDSVLEVGCGRGVVSRFLATKVRMILATDINPYAVKIVNGYGIPTVRSDLFRGIKGKFDMIIFNPPYLPTCQEEKIPGWMNFALDGGPSGRETIDRFIEDLNNYLAPGGRALLLVSSLTGRKDVEDRANAAGFDVSEAASERHFFEQLYILRLSSKRL